MCTIEKVEKYYMLAVLVVCCMDSSYPKTAAAAAALSSVQMLVKGIRSFSPDNNNVIEFYKPLTLIVGSNGAGKTVRVVWFLH
jgi:hypothetical protein